MCNNFSQFHVCWSVVTRGCVFLAVLFNSCQKTTMADFRYKSLKPWKIDNIDLTQLFSLSIFTDFRYWSIKITRLLPIFIDWQLRDFHNPNSTPRLPAYLRSCTSHETQFLVSLDARRFSSKAIQLLSSKRVNFLIRFSVITQWNWKNTLLGMLEETCL